MSVEAPAISVEAPAMPEKPSFAKGAIQNPVAQISTTPNPSMMAPVAWLGIALKPVPAIVTAQFPDLLKPSQGVLISGVNPQSPAAQAGLQINDILLNYDGTSLQSPSQLMTLVHADMPHQTISLQLLRSGKLTDVTATLGKRGPAKQAPPIPGNFLIPPQRPMMQQMLPMPVPPSAAPMMRSSHFQAIRMKQLPDGRFRAEIKFKDETGATKVFGFEGQREEILQQIHAQKGLPDQRKAALINALPFPPNRHFNNARPTPPAMPNPQNFQMPTFNMPGFNSQFAPRAQPPFSQEGFPTRPFNDPFFQHFFQGAAPPQPAEPQQNIPIPSGH